MEYFLVSIEQEGDQYWHLSIPQLNADGTWWDVWAFTRCERYSGPTPLRAVIDKPGRQTDFSWSLFGPILNERCARLFESYLTDAQLIPIRIDGARGIWYLLNVLTCLNCLDHSKSIIDYYPKDHKRKPGMPRGIQKYILKSDIVHGHPLFRIEDFKVALICNSDLLNALMGANVSGIQYWRVELS